MYVLGTILARAGSRGLADKCVRPLLGRAVIEYTFDHALSSATLDQVVFTTDSEPAATLARRRGIRVIPRPADLADDTAPVDGAVRHATLAVEDGLDAQVDIVVLLYGNIPVRAPGIIDRVVNHLIATRADSVRTVAPVSKQHPDWLHRLDGDKMVQFRPNNIYRRQDLTPLYYHDGAVAAVTRQALFAATAGPGESQAFLGQDRRAIVQAPDDCVDIDEEIDLYLAEALLRAKQPAATAYSSEPGIADASDGILSAAKDLAAKHLPCFGIQGDSSLRSE